MRYSKGLTVWVQNISNSLVLTIVHYRNLKNDLNMLKENVTYKQMDLHVGSLYGMILHDS